MAACLCLHQAAAAAQCGRCTGSDEGILRRAFEREYLDRYDPAKARFRTFVRVCLDGFLANAAAAASRLKRGGGFIIDAVDVARFDEDLATHVRSARRRPRR